MVLELHQTLCATRNGSDSEQAEYEKHPQGEKSKRGLRGRLDRC